MGGHICSQRIKRTHRYSQTLKTHLEMLYVFVGGSSVFITYRKLKVNKYGGATYQVEQVLMHINVIVYIRTGR